MLGTDEGSLSAYERAAYWRAVEDVRQAQRFFHWELEFPEVWRDAKGTPKKNGGFDAVLANPPWELLQTNSKEFYTNFDPLFKTYKKQDALRRISEWMHTMNQ